MCIRDRLKYKPQTLVAEAANTQLNAVRIAPADSNIRGPNLSIRKPWNGDRNVCATIRIAKVTCTSVSDALSKVVNSVVNKAHTYCGLEMAIMATTPKQSCHHLVLLDKLELVVLMRFINISDVVIELLGLQIRMSITDMSDSGVR